MKPLPEDKVAAILEGLTEGKSLRAMCREPGMPSVGAFLRRAAEDKAFAEQYARARGVGLDSMALEIIEIADDGTGDTWIDANGHEQTNHDVLGRSRLRVDARKWYLSKIAPKKYGDRIELAGDPDAPMVTRIERVIRRPQHAPDD